MDVDPRLATIDDCLYRLAVKAFIFHNGKVLLVREKDDEWWSFPGGGIDYGEDIRQALPRELAEELGVAESDIKTDYQVAYAAVGAVVNGIPRANLFFRVEVPVERLTATDDVLEFGWFAPAEITGEIAGRHISPSTGDPAELVQAVEANMQQR
ncbi:MAG TPA: NUDIX hydrolase [Candidatus Saccharimonadales bacterium]|nr:NUDIX hydrolase [Candidatus Saccharimonadales bacterium]